MQAVVDLGLAEVGDHADTVHDQTFDVVSANVEVGRANHSGSIENAFNKAEDTGRGSEFLSSFNTILPVQSLFGFLHSVNF